MASTVWSVFHPLIAMPNAIQVLLLGREPRVIGTAFGLEEGATSQLIVGANGVYAVQLIKSTPADALPNYQAAANRVGQTKSNAVNSQLYNALKDASEIEDYRATFY